LDESPSRALLIWRELKRGHVPADLVLFALAAFAIAWAIARACVQSMTGDEAESLELWVLRPLPGHWAPAANNHVLNSMLMRLFTVMFGLSTLTVRAPALIGAAVYIGVALWFCRMISPDGGLRIALFLCLVYNPFLFDFYVAARGYGMAVALLLWAIAIPAWAFLGLMHNRPRSLIKAYRWSSALIALSFVANFSFAFVDIATLLALMAWAWLNARERRWRVMAAAIWPGLVITLLLPSWTLLHWPSGQLYVGTRSLAETFRSVAQYSVFELSPWLVNPSAHQFLLHFRSWLIPLTCAIALILAIVLIAKRARLDNPHSLWLGRLATLIAAVVGVSILAHWIAYRLFGLLMPQGRLALWLAPMITLLIGVIAAMPPPARVAAALRRGLVIMMFATACWFTLCLRLTYFKEWNYQAEVNKAYDVVACYNHTRGVRDVEVGWWYHAAMNFYRILSGRENFRPFTSSADHHPVDRQLYVLNGATEGAFIQSQGLIVVYHGATTDIVVAARPEIASAAKNECYIPPPL